MRTATSGERVARHKPMPATTRNTEQPLVPESLVRFNQGMALQKAGRHLEAGEVFRHILKKNKKHAKTWTQLGIAAFAMDDLKAAQRYLKTAIKIDSSDPLPYYNLGVIDQRLGDMAAARRHLNRAISLKPDFAEAYFSLSLSHKFKRGDGTVDRVEALCKTSNLSKSERCFLHFAAGKMHDDMGKPSPAFAHFRDANRLMAGSYDRTWEETFTADQKLVFDKTLFDRYAGHGVESDAPIFIVGMARSGTTLVEQILSSHPKVAGLGELGDLTDIANALPAQSIPGAIYPGCLRDMDVTAHRQFADAYLHRTATLASGAARTVDKNPANFRHLGLIAIMFPNARIIHCMRSPLDVCLSCYFKKFATGMEHTFDLDDLAHYYRLYHDLMTHWREVLPLPIYDLSYEDMIENQEAVSRDLLAFCGLDWHPRCERFFENKRTVVTASTWQVRQPLYSSSVGRWKMYEAELQPLIKALGPLAKT